MPKVQEPCFVADFSALAEDIIRYGQKFYEMGWNLATSSNYSAVLEREPLRVVMTSSGKHKGELTAADLVVIDENLKVLPTGREVPGALPGKPSAEAALHLELLKRGAGSVLHSHSIWATVVSNRCFADGKAYVELSGYEMLKALDGVKTHDTVVRIPILDNTQDMTALAVEIGKKLDNREIEHGFLLRGHGLYTWGPTLSDARNRLEALEFLLEVVGRSGERA